MQSIYIPLQVCRCKIQKKGNFMDKLTFEAVIQKTEGMDAAYVVVPFDIKALFGKGRLLVHATFDGVPYSGQVVRMGTPNYILGIRKDIRAKIGKQAGDTVLVTIVERA